MQSLKVTAQQIIELTNQLDGRVHTWDQEEYAPAGGYTDRAGFIVHDDVELFADVYAPEEESVGLLRARLARSPKADDSQNLFTIITLDFKTDLEKTKAIITDSVNLSQQTLVTLLEDPNTVPNIIHVSLEAGKGTDGEQVGTRLEYDADELQNLPEAEQTDFVTTLNHAYNRIISKI